MQSELLKGHLDLLVLSVLSDSPAHGYAVVEQLRKRSDGEFVLPDGTVYPALYRLEAGGLITSRWDTSTGRRRRIYRLTRPGRKALEQQTKEWQRFTAAVRSVVRATNA